MWYICGYVVYMWVCGIYVGMWYICGYVIYMWWAIICISFTDERYSANMMEAVADVSSSGINSHVEVGRPVDRSNEQPPFGDVKSRITPSMSSEHLHDRHQHTSHIDIWTQ